MPTIRLPLWRKVGPNTLLDNDPMTLLLDQLPANELRSVLSVDVDELPVGAAIVVTDFIQRIGGRENAMLAVELLEEIEQDD